MQSLGRKSLGRKSLGRTCVRARARRWLSVASIALGVGLAGVVTTQTSATAQSMAGEAFRPWTGDFDGMLERGVVRILVPISPTLFYQSKGQNYGAEAEIGNEFEKLLNQRHGSASKRIRVVYIPTARGRIMDNLRAGRGDIAAANLTITPERAAMVDFARPWATGIKEILVTGPSAPKIESMADLAGREIKVPKASSYYGHLLAVNEDLVRSGKFPIKVTPLDDNPENEDMLEQVSAGLLPWAIVDSHIAKLWSTLLPDLVLREDIVFHDGGEIAWAMRKDSPRLKAELDQFVQTLRSSGFSK